MNNYTQGAAAGSTLVDKITKSRVSYLQGRLEFGMGVTNLANSTLFLLIYRASLIASYVKLPSTYLLSK